MTLCGAHPLHDKNFILGVRAYSFMSCLPDVVCVLFIKIGGYVLWRKLRKSEEKKDQQTATSCSWSLCSQ